MKVSVKKFCAAPMQNDTGPERKKDMPRFIRDDKEISYMRLSGVSANAISGRPILFRLTRSERETRHHPKIGNTEIIMTHIVYYK